jgi:hypothetical protein
MKKLTEKIKKEKPDNFDWNSCREKQSPEDIKEVNYTFKIPEALMDAGRNDPFKISFKYPIELPEECIECKFKEKCYILEFIVDDTSFNAKAIFNFYETFKTLSLYYEKYKYKYNELSLRDIQNKIEEWMIQLLHLSTEVNKKKIKYEIFLLIENIREQNVGGK